MKNIHAVIIEDEIPAARLLSSVITRLRIRRCVVAYFMKSGERVRASIETITLQQYKQYE